MYPCSQAILASLQKPLADLVLYVPKKRSIVVEETQETDECRASFAYLLFVQGIGIDYFPAVFR
jgi:hypothetical protein